MDAAVESTSAAESAADANEGQNDGNEKNGQQISEAEKDPLRDSPTESGQIEEDNYLHGARLVLLTITLMLGQFLMGIDATVITSALPTITSEFHRPFDVGWYGSTYLLTTIAFQPTFGKIYTYFNIKYTFFVSVLIFEAGSVICAVAKNSITFIIGRAFAGIGQAAMLAGGMVVIGYRIPLKNRALYFAVLTSMHGIASVIGPPLGGVLTDTPKLTWRFCFWINLPLGALSIITGLLCFQSPSRPESQLKFREKLAKMDIIGAILLIAGMVSLFLALQTGGSTYPWSDSRVWGCLLGFALIIGVFIAWQIYLGPDATMPPSIIGRRTISANCLYTCLISTGMSTHTYFLPFYFQGGKGVSAEASGLRLVPYLACLMISSLVTGILLVKVGYPVPFMWFGTILFAIGSGLLTTLTQESSAGMWIGYQILTGVGFGSTVNFAAVALQAELQPEEMAMGNAILLFNNFLGGAVAISIAQGIYSNILQQRLETLVPTLNADLIIQAGATGIGSIVPTQLVSLVRDAYVDGVTRAFFLPVAAAGLAMIFTFGIKWKNIKQL